MYYTKDIKRVLKDVIKFSLTMVEGYEAGLFELYCKQNIFKLDNIKN